ncbi:hypothetical protein [Sphingobacterium sp. BN32]|uniref:hypothetical protein n=1 Tax=Sphingobacterium sp. BN32 TaxID=3058432 RepID=UPI00265C92D6|nr:hypothetical protein [Sphingobacterium sp. BN32]WKK58382.1 hypothetical protein QYC40_17280 [Sphingobacterium sp. BN32]
MKKNFKNVNMLAIAGVLITGSALAMSGSTLQSPTHYNANSSHGTPDWQPIPPDKILEDCEGSEIFCSGVLVNGIVVPTANRGIPILVDAR